MTTVNSLSDIDLDNKSSNSPLVNSAADPVIARIALAQVVPAQPAVLAGSSVSLGVSSSPIIDSVLIAGITSNVMLPLTSEYVANPTLYDDSSKTLAGALEAFSKNLVNQLNEASFATVPIVSLSETAQVQDLGVGSLANQALESFGPLFPNASLSLPVAQSVVDVSALSSNAPVAVAALTQAAFTVIDSSSTNVEISNLIAPQAIVENFVNIGSGTLTVATTGTHLASLNLSGNVAFTATADQVTTGITVSGQSDSSNVNLYLANGADANVGGKDIIALGNGNDFVMDAGNGQITLDLGSGSNVVMLVGVGVNGNVNFAMHTDANSDVVVVAANSVSSASALASHPLVTITGLNNEAHSNDSITFLGDMGSALSWANGSGAAGAQVVNVQGDSANLVNWISAAQNDAHAAHSVSWFQFNGNTYVLESALGAAGNHIGDTVIKLTGLTQFTGSDGELAFGMLHLAG